MRDALFAAALVVSIAAGARAGRRSGAFLGLFGAALGAAAFAAARFLPGPAFLRGLASMYGVAAVGKTLALGRTAGRGLPPGRGVGYLVAYPGLDFGRAFVRDDAASRASGWLAGLLALAELAAAVLVASAGRALEDVGGDVVRTFLVAWARAAAFAWLLDGLFRGAMGGLKVLGFRTETVFDAPWTLAGLADFWSRRWNRFVSRTLGHEVYAPAKRRVGRAAAILAAFAASGLLHDAMFAFAVGPTGWRYSAFFAIQGLGIVVEAALFPGTGGPPRRRFARWAFAWVVLVATAPLFFGGPYPEAVPIDRLVGLHR